MRRCRPQSGIKGEIADLPEKGADSAREAPAFQGVFADVASALGNLGFRKAEIDRAVAVLTKGGDTQGPFEEVLKKALGLLREM